ncbi:MAG: hypothetical protein H7263_12765 [Candidatus Sericytochromatia bacterium]|nr:hypothetical protein [Candidatus Sericytochromatia bacterium]
MQLIKDFSDIPRFVGFLNSDYQQKLLLEINNLLVTFMDEQTRNIPANSIPKTTDEIKEDIQPELKEKVSFIKPINSPNSSLNPDASNGLNNIRNTFNKSNSSTNNLPPLPSPIAPMNMNRTIGAGGFNLKVNIGAAKSPNKKQTMHIVEAMTYITPSLSEVGENLLRSTTTSLDLQKFLRQIDGKSNLKEVYLFTSPTSNLWGKFIERLYPLYKERALNLKKEKNYPNDSELSIKLGDMLIALGLIDEAILEKALEYQKNPPAQQATPIIQQSTGQSWIDRTRNLVNQNETVIVPQARKRLGEVILEMRLITKDELENAATLQKWIKNIIEHS